jgi:anti-sigma B factor antagonist
MAATIHLPERWTITTGDQATEIVVAGSLDLQSAPALREALLASVLGGSTIILDLRQCTFIDSIGLSVILAGLNRANQEAATLRFRLSDTVERVLRISGVLPLISVEVPT